MRSDRLWAALGSAAMLCTVVLLTGFVLALKDAWFPGGRQAAVPEEPVPAEDRLNRADRPEIFVTALGDSLTRGTGDNTGQGYVRRAVDGLAETLDKPVRLVNNLAINGLTTGQLEAMLEERGVQHAIAGADILLLSVGGNDLFRLATGSGSLAEGDELSVERVQARMPEAAERLRRIFARLRDLHPEATIVYIGLYNPFFDLPRLREASALIQEWNAAAHKAAVAHFPATVVPTYDLFEMNGAKYLSSDHFHPNAEGYARIAERVVQALL